jgi:hypothetical protein
MPADLYNWGAISVWREHGCPIQGVPGTERFPLILPAINHPVRVVYSGINPSFNIAAVSAYANHVNCPLHYFEWTESITDEEVISRMERLRAFEAHARVSYPYFTYFERFSSDIGVDHASTTHIDVLPLRATNQQELLKALGRHGDQKSVGGFIAAQRSIYAEVLRVLDPEIVLIANASAARWLRDELPLVPDTSRRTYRWAAAPRATFFLSGQLSGGATDEFAWDRLAADIRDVLRANGLAAT